MNTQAYQHNETMLVDNPKERAIAVARLKRSKQIQPEKVEADKTRFSLEMNAEMKETFDSLLDTYKGASKADVLRKAILLLSEVKKAQARGETLAFTKGDSIVYRVVGIGL